MALAINLFVLAIIFAVSIYFIVRLFVSKRIAIPEVAIMMIPPLAAVPLLVVGTVMGNDFVLVSLAMSFTLFSVCSQGKCNMMQKGLVSSFVVTLVYLLTLFGYLSGALIVCCIEDIAVLLMTNVWDFHDVKHLVRKHSMIEHVNLSMNNCLISVSLAVAVAALFVINVNEPLWLELMLESAATLTFVWLYLRFARDKMLFLSRDKVNEIERLTLGYVHNSVAINKNDEDDILFARIIEHFADAKPYVDPDFCVSALAKSVFSNKTYVSRAIQSHTGKTFPTFVKGYRLNHAQELFKKDMSLKVSELALRSGFGHASSFNHAFKEELGMSPTVWMTLCRSQTKK